MAITLNGPSATAKPRFQVISSELQILGSIGGRATGPKMATLSQRWGGHVGVLRAEVRRHGGRAGNIERLGTVPASVSITATLPEPATHRAPWSDCPGSTPGMAVLRSESRLSEDGWMPGRSIVLMPPPALTLTTAPSDPPRWQRRRCRDRPRPQPPRSGSRSRRPGPPSSALTTSSVSVVSAGLLVGRLGLARRLEDPVQLPGGRVDADELQAQEPGSRFPRPLGPTPSSPTGSSRLTGRRFP